MFSAILLTQWKLTRWPLLGGVLLAFGIPVLSVSGMGQRLQAVYDPFYYGNGPGSLAVIEAWSVAYPVLAMALALVVAILAWNPDHRGRHVYPLSLPLPRWHYSLLRLGAGATLLAAPIVALGFGALLATSLSDLGPGTTAHPYALTIRFALATALAYAMFFAACTGTERSARYAGAVAGSIVAAHILFALLGGPDILNLVGEGLLLWPGPLQIFTGRWMLIDV